MFWCIKKPIKDLFYAMSHGVNRATLKKGKNDSRIHFLNSLIKKLENIDYIFMVSRIRNQYGVMIFTKH